ncbi:periplasmic/secreted protein [Pseudomonas aeruginosa]|nr:periplasmic/secreted protein [Pseudomonas aeruginosa]
MGGMDFSIADATRKKNEDQLMKGAVDAFKERAQLLTEALGGKGYKLVSLSVNSAGAPRPYPVMRMAAMKADASFGGAQAPEIEAGTSQVTVNADGVIEGADALIRTRAHHQEAASRAASCVSTVSRAANAPAIAFAQIRKCDIPFQTDNNIYTEPTSTLAAGTCPA